MECEICKKEETLPTEANISAKVSNKYYGCIRNLCYKCHQKERTAGKRSGGFSIIKRVVDSSNYREYTWAYSELLDLVSSINKEQSKMIFLIKKLEKEKSVFNDYMDKLIKLSDKDPSLRYEFARKEANAALSNKKTKNKDNEPREE